MLGVKSGDYITIKEDETESREIQIQEITENYYMNYLYLSETYYHEVFGENPSYNTIFLNYTVQNEQMESEIGTDLLAISGISQITFYSNLSGRIMDMLKSMDSVILVLVLSAGALAFVVLYNLNNINVTERKRELSTLKVLGFAPFRVMPKF